MDLSNASTSLCLKCSFSSSQASRIIWSSFASGSSIGTSSTEIVISARKESCMVKPVLSGHSKIVFQDQLSLNAGQKYCRMLQESILQYVWPSLSYHLSLRPLFKSILSGRLRQVLLYYYLTFGPVDKIVIHIASVSSQVSGKHMCRLTGSLLLAYTQSTWVKVQNFQNPELSKYKS